MPAGAVKRIRGVAHSMRVSPQSSNRMVDGTRGVLNALLADVYIFSDHMSGPEAGKSPGFGTMLVAETTTGCLISAESTADVQQQVGSGTVLDAAILGRLDTVTSAADVQQRVGTESKQNTATCSSGCVWRLNGPAAAGYRGNGP